MPDIGTATAAVRLLKEVIQLAKESNNAELKDKVSELQNLIFDLTTENRDLRERAAEIEHANDISKEMVYESGLYWRVKDGKRDGPFCPACWDDRRKAVHLPSLGFGGHTCAVCHGHF
jgi:hypothetical protein